MLVSKERIVQHYKTWLGLFLITSIFVLANYHNITNPINTDYGAVPRSYLDTCHLLQFPETRAPLKAWMLCVSEKYLGDINFIPFAFATGLIPLTFLLIRKITHDQRSALIGSGLLLLSPIISYLGTTASLSTEWVFFMLLSAYLAYRQPKLAGVAFFASVAAKGLTLVLLPFLVWWIIKSDIKNKTHALVSLGCAAVVIGLISFFGYNSIIQQVIFGFYPDEIAQAAYDTWFVFRSDPLQFVLVPLGIILSLQSKNPIGKPLGIMMAFYWSLVFLFPIFSFYMMFDYRMIPLIIFAAISIGMNHKNLKSIISKPIAGLGLSRYNKRV